VRDELASSNWCDSPAHRLGLACALAQRGGNRSAPPRGSPADGENGHPGAVPVPGVQAEGDEACCFCCGNMEQTQGGLGEPVDRGLRDAVGVALVQPQPQQPEQVSGNGSQRKLRAGNGKAPGGLPGLDVTQGTWRLPAGAPSTWSPAPVRKLATSGCDQPSRPGTRQGTDKTSAGSLMVDHLPRAFQYLRRRRFERLLLAGEVVAKRPGPDVGRLDDLLDARALPAPRRSTAPRCRSAPAASAPCAGPAGSPRALSGLPAVGELLTPARRRCCRRHATVRPRDAGPRAGASRSGVPRFPSRSPRRRRPGCTTRTAARGSLR
jgi:hypothetical protein